MSLQIHQCLPVLAVVFLRLRQRCSGVWVPCSVMFCLPPPATRAAHCSGGLCYGGDDHMAALLCALSSVWSPQWGVGGTRRATDHEHVVEAEEDVALPSSVVTRRAGTPGWV